MTAQKKIIEILNGNELIVQGALEAGFDFFTGYPGSPLAEYFNILYKRKSELEKLGKKVAIGNSEANASAMATGAKFAGKDVFVAMKSMGLHVSSDALSVANFGDIGIKDLKGSIVIAVGDDPLSMSTATPADSRYLFQHLHIPFLLPSNPDELKNWIKIAKEISKESSIIVGIILDTFLAEGGGRVEVLEIKASNKDKEIFNSSQFDLSKRVLVPPNSLQSDIRMIQHKFPRAIEAIQKYNLDKIFGENKSIGILSSGATFEIVKEVVEDFNLFDYDLSLYKVAIPYPLVQKSLKKWVANKKYIIVVEEKRGFLEMQLNTFLKDLVASEDNNIQVYGKKFANNSEGFNAYGGLNYDQIKDKLLSLDLFCKDEIANNKLSSNNKSLSQKLVFKKFNGNQLLLKRFPTFCPGCPHRETLSVLKDLRLFLKKENIDFLNHGDVGCYSLSFLPPFKEMHDLSCMGQGGALAAGMDMYAKNPSVNLMGDSTFFHSGITSLSNSIQINHNILYIILNNDNTAMTGHQMTPTSGINIGGESRPIQSIFNIVKSMGISDIYEVNPSDRSSYFALISKLIKRKGVKVIVSQKECGLTYHSKLKKKESVELQKSGNLSTKVFYRINSDACENCLACVEMTGCPGLSKEMTLLGEKVKIDQNICVGDSYCTQIKKCPSFEKIIVKNYHPSKYKKQTSSNNSVAYNNIKAPKRKITFEDIAAGKDLRIVVTGVGGSGITTISRVLAESSRIMQGREDIDFKFFDQKGLAQRNGNVTSHLSFFKKGLSKSPIIPEGKANVLISSDLLDTTFAIKFLPSNKSHNKIPFICIFDQNYQVPLGIMLDKSHLSVEKLAKDLTSDFINSLGENNVFSYKLKDLSRLKLGKSVYSNSMILGILFQRGFLPFNSESIEQAYQKIMRADLANKNIEAFRIGRLLTEKIDNQSSVLDELELELELENKEEIKEFKQILQRDLRRCYFTSKASNLLENINDLNYLFEFLKQKEILNCLYTILVFDYKLLDNFKSDLKIIFNKLLLKYNNSSNKIKETRDFISLLKEFIYILQRSYVVKDEIFIAQVLSSKLSSKNRDNEFLELGQSYKVEFINRPHIDLTKNKALEFDMSPKMWMFDILKYCRFVRKYPFWHKKEEQIKMKIKTELFESLDLNIEEMIIKIDFLYNARGYRDKLYESI